MKKKIILFIIIVLIIAIVIIGLYVPIIRIESKVEDKEIRFTTEYIPNTLVYEVYLFGKVKIIDTTFSPEQAVYGEGILNPIETIQVIKSNINSNSDTIKLIDEKINN